MALALSHKSYAQFMSQAAIFNAGCSLGLLCGGTTRMASLYYSIHRCLRQHRVLLVTIHSNLWESIDMTAQI